MTIKVEDAKTRMVSLFILYLLAPYLLQKMLEKKSDNTWKEQPISENEQLTTS